MKTFLHNRNMRNMLDNFSSAGMICLILVGMILTSCSDDEREKTLGRLFRPIAFISSISENSVNLSWVPISGATYLLEISRDSLLFQTELISYPLGKVSYYGIDELWSNTRYSARIKSISADPNIFDSEYQEITFVTQTENVFYIVDSQNIGTEWIVVHWLKSKNVSHITVSAENTPEITLNISEAEKAIGEKRITKLKPKTKYTLRMYLAEMLRGTTSVTTK